MAICLLIGTSARRGFRPAIGGNVIGHPHAIYAFCPDRRYIRVVFHLPVPKFVDRDDHGGLLPNVYRRFRRETRDIRVLLTPWERLVVANCNVQTLPRVRVGDPFQKLKGCTKEGHGLGVRTLWRVQTVIGRWLSFVDSKGHELKGPTLCPSELGDADERDRHFRFQIGQVNCR